MNPTKKDYRIAMLIYPADEKHLVFQDNPEVVLMEDMPCVDESDIDATAAQVKRYARKAVETYEAPDEQESDDL